MNEPLGAVALISEVPSLANDPLSQETLPDLGISLQENYQVDRQSTVEVHGSECMETELKQCKRPRLSSSPPPSRHPKKDKDDHHKNGSSSPSRQSKNKDGLRKDRSTRPRPPSRPSLSVKGKSPTIDSKKPQLSRPSSSEPGDKKSRFSKAS